MCSIYVENHVDSTIDHLIEISSDKQFLFFFRSDLTRHTYSRHGATRRSEIVSITVNLIFKRLKNLNFKRQVLDKILRFEV